MNSTMCRLCYHLGATSYIFQETLDNIQISTKIMFCCSNLKIIEGDGLPTYVCSYCERELHNCYQFILKCEDTDKKFRSSFNSSQDFNDPQRVEIKIESNIDDENHYDQINETDCFDVKSEEFENQIEVPKKRRHKNRSKYKQISTHQCPDCNRKCGTRSALLIHMRVHTNEKPFACTICDKTYKDRSNLIRHIDRNHHPERERNYMCEHCGKGFFSKRDVKTHMRTHTGETPYTCNICSKSFSQSSSLIRHQLRHKGERSHACSLCHKAFCTKEELRNHMLVHTTEKKFSCPICNVPFKYQSNLNKHLRVHREPNRFVCNHCGRKFNLKGNLKIHIDSQHSEKSGYCNMCSKSFPNFEVHMWRHTGHRPLKCELCSSSFFELKALGRHVNYKHKQTEKYKCLVEGCLLGFPSKPMLEFHTAKIHSMDIPFPCDSCSRGFYRKNDLARHKIGTHKEKLQ